MSPTETLGRYKSYPAYKDSGVDWLGLIPAHWNVRRLKYLAAINPEALGEDTDPTRELLYLDIGGVDGLGRIGPLEALAFASAPSRARRVVRDRDVIVSTVRTYLRAIAAIDNPDPRFVVSTGFAVVRPSEGVDSRFVAYSLRAPYFVERVVANSTGVSYPSINETELATFELSIPPSTEQRRIVSFLENKTLAIDALIEKNARLIVRLREQINTRIEAILLRGLDPSSPRRESGAQWLGRVPSHWAVERIKWCAKLVSGHTPDKKIESYWRGGDVPWLSLADTNRLRENDYLDSTSVYTTADGLANSSAHVLPVGTVVFSRDASVGLCGITRVGMAVSQHFIGWICGPRLLPEYLLFVLRAMTAELERLTMGATVKTIGMSDVKSLITPVPPVAEQRQIVGEVFAQRSQLDASIKTATQAIAKLKELRAALTSAAVTGQIDVREEVA